MAFCQHGSLSTWPPSLTASQTRPASAFCCFLQVGTSKCRWPLFLSADLLVLKTLTGAWIFKTLTQVRPNNTDAFCRRMSRDTNYHLSLSLTRFFVLFHTTSPKLECVFPLIFVEHLCHVVYIHHFLKSSRQSLRYSYPSHFIYGANEIRRVERIIWGHTAGEQWSQDLISCSCLKMLWTKQCCEFPQRWGEAMLYSICWKFHSAGVSQEVQGGKETPFSSFQFFSFEELL